MKQKSKTAELSDGVLSQVLQVSPFPVVIKDSSLIIRFVNKAFCKLMQQSESDLIGTTGLENVPSEIAEKCKLEDAKVLDSGETLEIEETYPTEGDQTVTFRTKKSRFTADNGDAYLIVQLQDVTSFKQQSADLKASNKELLAFANNLEKQQAYHKAILDNVNEAILLVDAQGGIKYRSPKAKLIGGYTDDDILGAGIFKLFHPDDVGSALDSMRAIVENPGVPFNVEYRVRHKRGYYMWLAGTVVNHLMDDAVNAIVINYTDISWKKSALSTSLSTEFKYQDLFNSMTDMFHVIELVYDEDGKPIDFIELEINKAVEKLYGLPADKIVGQRITTIVEVVEDYWLEVFDGIMKTGMPAFFEEFNEGLNRYFSINAWKTTDSKLAVIFSDITPRKVAEEDLNRKNELLDQAQELTNLGGWELDLKTNKIYWTEQTYRIHEVDPETWTPTVESGIDFYTPESQKKISAALNAAIQQQTNFDLELKFITAKGKLIDVRASGKTVVEDGEVVRIVGAFQNITNQKQAQLELQRQRVLLDNTQELTKLGGWEFDLRTNSLFWTEQTYRIHEVDPNTWVPNVEEAVEFYTPESQERISEALQNAIDSQGNFDLELQLTTAKNNLIDVRATGQTVVEGEKVVKVIGAFQDVTEQKKAEHKLQRQKILLDDAQGIAKVGGWQLDISTGNLYWTKTTYQIYETSPEEFDPTVDSGVDTFLPGSREKIEEALDKAVNQGEPYDLELEAYTTKGRRIDVRATCVVSLKDGKPHTLTGSFQDITDWKKVQRELVSHKELLDESQRIGKLGGWEYDLKNNEHLFSEEVYRIYEVSESDFDFKSLDHYLPESKEIIEKAFDEALKTGAGFDLELQLKSSSGIIKDVRSTCKVEIIDGKPVRLTGIIQDITEYKALHREIADSKRFFVESQIAAAIGSYRLNIQEDAWESSEVLNDILGIEKGYVKTVESWSKLIHPAEREAMLNYFQQEVIGKQKEFNKEYRIVRPSDGEERWMLGLGKVIYEDGNPTEMVGTVQDITLRKVTETALIKSEERFRQVMDAADIWVWEVDANGLYTYVSPHIKKILGYSPNEVVGKMHFYDLLTEGDRERIKDFTFERFESKETLSNLVNANAHKDGHTVVLETNGFPILDDKGNLKGYQGSDKDVSDRVLRDKEIVKLSKAVSQNPASVVITDLDGNIEYVNEKFEKVTGYSFEEARGKNPSILNSGELPASVYKTLWATVLGGDVWHGVFHNVRKDGTMFWERASIGPIINDEDEIISLMAVKEDITREKEFEFQLQETLENLEVTVEERTKDLKAATNELQTAHNEILSSIAYAQRIQQASTPSEKSLQRVVVDAFAIYKPRDIVSGDFYWYFRTENGVVLAVVDCTGHGVPGAMLSMIAVELLNHIVKGRKTYSPSSILEQMNYGVISVLHNGSTQGMRDGMDMSVVNIDYKTKTVQYSGANSAGIIVRGDSFKRLNPTRQSIGGLKTENRKEFLNTTVEFNDGDRLYLYSDGYADQFGGPNNKKFLRKRLEKLIVETASQQLSDQRFVLQKTLDSWMEGYRQTDDITLIGLEI